MTKKDVEAFAFEVLNELMEPSAYIIEQAQNGEIRVIVTRPNLVYAPMDIVREDWKRSSAGTEFERVRLYLPVQGR